MIFVLGWIKCQYSIRLIYSLSDSWGVERIIKCILYHGIGLEKYILLGFVLGYAFSFFSPEWYYFVNSNFINFCRWAELPDVAWIMMDKYIFFGAL